MHHLPKDQMRWVLEVALTRVGQFFWLVQISMQSNAPQSYMNCSCSEVTSKGLTLVTCIIIIKDICSVSEIVYNHVKNVDKLLPNYSTCI